jgi:hypothetical protein
MKNLNLEDFLALGWSPGVRAKLADLVKSNPDVRYLVAWDNAGKLSGSAFSAQPEVWPDHAVALWSKDVKPKAAKVAKAKPVAGPSRTMQAVALVADGMSTYAAAKQIGVNQSAVHRAITRRVGKEICSHCGQVVKSPAAG